MKLYYFVMFFVVFIVLPGLGQVKYKTSGYRDNVILMIYGKQFTEFRDYDRNSELLKEVRLVMDKIELQRLYQDGIEYRQILSRYNEKNIQRLVFQSFDRTKPLKLVLFRQEPYRIWYADGCPADRQLKFFEEFSAFIKEKDKPCADIVNFIKKQDTNLIKDCLKKKFSAGDISQEQILNKIEDFQDKPVLSCQGHQASSSDPKTGQININPKDHLDLAVLEELIHLSNVGFHTGGLCSKEDNKGIQETEQKVKKIRDSLRACIDERSEEQNDNDDKLKVDSEKLNKAKKIITSLKKPKFENEYYKKNIFPIFNSSEKYLDEFLKEVKDDVQCKSIAEKLKSIHGNYCKNKSDIQDCLMPDVCTSEVLKSTVDVVQTEYDEAIKSCDVIKNDVFLVTESTQITNTPNVSQATRQVVVSTAPGETKSGVFPESAGGRSGFNFPTPKSLDSFKNNFGQVVSGLGGSAFSGPSSSKGETVLMKSTDAGSALSSKPTYSYPKGNGALDIQFSKNPNLLASNTTGLPAGLDSSRFNGSVTGSATSGAEKMGASQIQSKGGASPAPKSGGSVGSPASGATDVGDVQFGGSGTGVRMPAAAQAQAQAKTRSSASENRAAKKNFNLDELKNKASVDDCKSYAQSLADNVSIRCGGKPAREEKPGSSYYNFEVVNGIRKVQKWDPMNKKWKDTP